MASVWSEEAVGAPVPVVEAEREEHRDAPADAARRAARCPSRGGCRAAAARARSRRWRRRRSDDARGAATPTTRRPRAIITIRPCTGRRRRTARGRSDRLTSATSVAARLERERAVGVGHERRRSRRRRTSKSYVTQPPRNTVGPGAAQVGRELLGPARTGACPTSSLGTSVAPRTGHGPAAAASPRPRGRRRRRSRARTAPARRRSGRRPASSRRGATRRTAPTSADGTDCAMRIITLPVPHVGVPSTPRSWAGVNRPAVACTPNERPRRRPATASPTRSGLHRWSEIGRRGGASARKLRQQVAAVLLHDRAELGRARDAARGGERLGDLVGREEPQRALVHAVGVGAHREHEHHVGEVDGLAPRRRAHLREGDVDEQQVAVADEQVGGLDVAVREPGVPELADQRQALVDDRRRRPRRRRSRARRRRTR